MNLCIVIVSIKTNSLMKSCALPSCQQRIISYTCYTYLIVKSWKNPKHISSCGAPAHCSPPFFHISSWAGWVVWTGCVVRGGWGGWSGALTLFTLWWIMPSFGCTVVLSWCEQSAALESLCWAHSEL